MSSMKSVSSSALPAVAYQTNQSKGITMSDIKNSEGTIDLDDVFSYGILDMDDPDTIKDFIFAATYIRPFTWTAIENEPNKKDKILLFTKSKIELAKEGVKPKPKNAAFTLRDGDAWVTYEHINEIEGNKAEIRNGIAVVDKDVIKDLVDNDMVSSTPVITVSIDDDNKINIDCNDNCPDFIKKMAEDICG